MTTGSRRRSGVNSGAPTDGVRLSTDLGPRGERDPEAVHADEVLDELRAIWDRAPVPRERWHAWVDVIADCTRTSPSGSTRSMPTTRRGARSPA